MPSISDEFEHWIRSDFVEINTALEELYFQLEHRDAVCGVGIPLKEQLRKQGENLVAKLAKEGNTNDGFDNAFGVLGNLGLFLASLRRHELTNPDRESASPFAGASALGMHIASSLGVVPRFATGHLTTHNRAVNGTIKSFTTLPDELLFLEYNARGVLSYKRAAESLLQLVPLEFPVRWRISCSRMRPLVCAMSLFTTRNCLTGSTWIVSSTMSDRITSLIGLEASSIAAQMRVILQALT